MISQRELMEKELQLKKRLSKEMMYRNLKEDDNSPGTMPTDTDRGKVISIPDYDLVLEACRI